MLTRGRRLARAIAFVASMPNASAALANSFASVIFTSLNGFSANFENPETAAVVSIILTSAKNGSYTSLARTADTGLTPPVTRSFVRIA